MTMPPQLAPQMPKLDPTNPYQMYDFWTQWLQLTDKQALAESDKEIGEWAAEEVAFALDYGMKAKGFYRGNPQQRMEAYVRKYEWPGAVDRETGMLLHPGEDLWAGQRHAMPRQFHTDALDAVKLGAPVPDWVRAYALANGHEDGATASTERGPLQDTYVPETRQGLVA